MSTVDTLSMANLFQLNNLNLVCPGSEHMWAIYLTQVRYLQLPELNTVSPGNELPAQVHVWAWLGEVAEWVVVHDPTVVCHQELLIVSVAQRLVSSHVRVVSAVSEVPGGGRRIR